MWVTGFPSGGCSLGKQTHWGGGGEQSNLGNKYRVE